MQYSWHIVIRFPYRTQLGRVGFLGIATLPRKPPHRCATSYAHFQRSRMRFGTCTHTSSSTDLKPSNILLQSYLSDERGFKTRVSDFGLIHLLSDDGCSTNTTTCGTFTHMAPEQMMLGACITQKVDAYSFGIIMWEMWEGGVPYEGCGVLDLVQLVVHMNVRPTFEGDVPRSYSHLTHKCWQQDPALRPSFAEIICYLQQMLEQVTDQGYLL
eukprot:TRINITY_DN50779_c0_g1_i1.p1 TRINITY_DN50779_c0_g1~~TRINITY_DN50779_c0_g1_i1.p1  ORF type:complete len:213 (+),score=16.15 TRINITY_DN50779_c0_g1_i1:5-643(+)